MGQNSAKQRLSRQQVRELKRHVSFTEEEIGDWWKEFTYCRTQRDASGQLFLSEEEFVRKYNSVFPGKGDEFARHVFRTFDRDRDSRVNFREFLIGLSVSGSMNVDKKLHWAFQVYDVKQEGCITRAGMAEIIRAVFRMIGPVQLDDSLPQSPEDMADQLFHELDKDGDDVITWWEFRDGALRYPLVVNLLQCGTPDESEETDNVSSMNNDSVFS